MLSRRARKILADAALVKKAHNEIDNLPLFDMDADTGGRAVDETDTAKARRETRIPGAYTCPRCSQMVRPGPHTLQDIPIICSENR